MNRQNWLANLPSSERKKRKVGTPRTPAGGGERMSSATQWSRHSDAGGGASPPAPPLLRHRKFVEPPIAGCEHSVCHALPTPALHGDPPRGCGETFPLCGWYSEPGVEAIGDFSHCIGADCEGEQHPAFGRDSFRERLSDLGETGVGGYYGPG